MLKWALVGSLEWCLSQGRHRVEDWLCEQRLAIADFSENPQSSPNLNSVEDLEAAGSPDLEGCPGARSP
jgi:molybdopterin-guanine dinucleotide biosynthesis protein A